MRVLQVVEAYADAGAHAWLRHTHHAAPAHPHVLLQHDAVRFALLAPAGDDALDVTTLIELGVAIYVVSDDAAERGIAPSALAPRVQLIARADVPELYAAHDQIWLW